MRARFLRVFVRNLTESEKRGLPRFAAPLAGDDLFLVRLQDLLAVEHADQFPRVRVGYDRQLRDVLVAELDQGVMDRFLGSDGNRVRSRDVPCKDEGGEHLLLDIRTYVHEGDDSRAFLVVPAQ